MAGEEKKKGERERKVMFAAFIHHCDKGRVSLKISLQIHDFRYAGSSSLAFSNKKGMSCCWLRFPSRGRIALEDE